MFSRILFVSSLFFLAIMSSIVGLSGCSEDQKAMAFNYSEAFLNGGTVTPSASETFTRKANELNERLLEVDAKIQAIQENREAASKEQADKLEAQRRDLMTKRDDVVDALVARQNALRQQGQTLERQYQEVLETLRNTGDSVYYPDSQS